MYCYDYYSLVSTILFTEHNCTAKINSWIIGGVDDINRG